MGLLHSGFRSAQSLRPCLSRLTAHVAVAVSLCRCVAVSLCRCVCRCRGVGGLALAGPVDETFLDGIAGIYGCPPAVAVYDLSDIDDPSVLVPFCPAEATVSIATKYGKVPVKACYRL